MVNKLTKLLKDRRHWFYEKDNDQIMSFYLNNVSV